MQTAVDNRIGPSAESRVDNKIGPSQQDPPDTVVTSLQKQDPSETEWTTGSTRRGRNIATETGTVEPTGSNSNQGQHAVEEDHREQPRRQCSAAPTAMEV